MPDPIWTAHLAVEADGGSVYIEAMPNATLDQEVRCGRMTRLGGLLVRWPKELGEEPDWFDDEVAELAANWSEARAERRAEARAYYEQVCRDYDESRFP